VTTLWNPAALGDTKWICPVCGSNQALISRDAGRPSRSDFRVPGLMSTCVYDVACNSRLASERYTIQVGYSGGIYAAAERVAVRAALWVPRKDWQQPPQQVDARFRTRPSRSGCVMRLRVTEGQRHGAACWPLGSRAFDQNGYGHGPR